MKQQNHAQCTNKFWLALQNIANFAKAAKIMESLTHTCSHVRECEFLSSITHEKNIVGHVSRPIKSANPGATRNTVVLVVRLLLIQVNI